MVRIAVCPGSPAFQCRILSGISRTACHSVAKCGFGDCCTRLRRCGNHACLPSAAGYRGKGSRAVPRVLSLLICGLVAIAAVTSRALPTAAGAPQVGQKVPDFTLADTSGNKVSLEQLLKLEGRDAVFRAGGITSAKFIPAPKAVLLVFYRGYW